MITRALSSFDLLLEKLSAMRSSRTGPSSIRFKAQDPFNRLRNAQRGSRAIHTLRSQPGPYATTRQGQRALLLEMATAEVRERYSHDSADGKRRFFTLGRKARRSLARAGAASLWRKQYEEVA